MGEEHIPKNAAREPAFQFYASDWLSDPELRSCSVQARGLFIDLMCLMHKSSVYGKLLINGSIPPNRVLNGLLRIHYKTFNALVKELLYYGVLKVDKEGVYYNARMMKDKALREKQRAYGKLGGNPVLTGKRVNPQDKGGLIPSSSSSSSSSNNVNVVRKSGGNGKNPRPMLDTPLSEIDARPRWWTLQERLDLDDGEEKRMMYLIQHYPAGVINEKEQMILDYSDSIPNRAAYFTAQVKNMKDGEA